MSKVTVECKNKDCNGTGGPNGKRVIGFLTEPFNKAKLRCDRCKKFTVVKGVLCPDAEKTILPGLKDPRLQKILGIES